MPAACEKARKAASTLVHTVCIPKSSGPMLQLPSPPYTLSVKPGTSLRGAARELTRAGVIPGEWVLVGLARFTGADRNMKAGSYEFPAGTTLALTRRPTILLS